MKWLSCVSLVICIAGCGGSDADRFIPASSAARQALDAALAAWKSGDPPGLIADQTPPVRFVDSNRKAGQQLVDYEILGEVAAEGQRAFLVQLHLDNPKEDPKVRFSILGVDPLWVLPQEELEMIAHWDCSDPEASQKWLDEQKKLNHQKAANE